VDAQVHDPPGEPNGQDNGPADPPAERAEHADKPARQSNEPRDVASEPADLANEPADLANERKGLRALFRDAASADQSTTGTGPQAAMPTHARSGTRQRSPGSGALAGDGPRARSASPPPRGTTAEEQPAGIGREAASSQQFAGPVVSRSLVSPRLRSDPRLRVWITRAVVALALYVGITIWGGWHDWRYGLTAAVVYAAADTIFRSKTAVVVPAWIRITSAQRFTRRRLRIVRLTGYHAMHARTVPGTKHVIDHVVVGPAGVFTFDSQRLDRRLPLRMRDGMLYHGRASMERRLDHARLEAGYAKRLIENELGQPVAVHPAMVVYGPKTSWMIMRVKGVDVFDGHRIGRYFRRQSSDVRRGSAHAKSRLSPERIEMIIAAAERALPALS
jgi:hypothetical protein